ncbi:MAG: T9SS type A sorting domain-containing protein [Ignavibacteria bacterium]|nr:T9SS type A sorting domain-containing protein [Ignavibacteria bacterium]
MKKLLLAVVLLSVFAFAGNVQVTFRVNLKIQLQKGLFNKATDSICVRGNFQTPAGDAGDWSGYKFKLTDGDNDSIYTVNANIPTTWVDSTFLFKFVKNDNGWEPDPNRTFKLQNVVNQILPVYYFSNDSVYKPTVSNTFNFTADMRSFYGTGDGYFDPNRDSLLVMGMDWDNLGTYVSGDRKCKEVPSPVKRFKTSLVIKGSLGDSTRFKFKAYPDAHYNNSGWELGQDRWVKYVADGGTVTIPEIVPDLSPSVITTTPIPVLFQVDMGKSPMNAKTSVIFDPTKIQFVGVKGGSKPIGNWAGNWVTADTIGGDTAQMIVLNDKGLNGDVTANDKVYSKKITWPANSQGGKIEYKYGCHYTGDTVGVTSTFLDNEGGFGQNHFFQLAPATLITLSDRFGCFVRSVEYNPLPAKAVDFVLEQNYPNPFNPTTTFNVVIPKEGNVSLKIYNIMGQEVETLISGVQKPGTMKVTFNGYGMASGVYFYRLEAGNVSITRKMMLMK